MAAIEIGQLPLTTAFTNTTFVAVENANVTQKIEASSIRTFVTSLEFLNSAGNVTAANLVTAGRLTAADVLTSGQLRSTIGTGTAPLSVSSTTQVPNLYASRAALADVVTDGLITTTTFANIAATDIIITGNYNSLSANLRSVNTNVGTYGNTAIVPQLTVDNKGRITAISNVAITFPAQTLISNTSEITANTVSGTPGLNLTTTGVIAGTYGGAINVPQITVDAKGRVTNIQSIPVNSTLNTLNVGIPIGTIALWSGPLSTIPDGWQICDGTNGTVDLRDRFVVGAGSLYNPGTTGGSADAVLPSHTHTATSTSTFTGTALPAHSHGLTDNGHRHLTGSGGESGLNNRYGDNGNMGTGWRIGNAGGPGVDPWTNVVATGISINTQTAGTPSGTVVTSTTLSTEGVTASNRNLPPYYALYYIQKMTDSVSINNPINFMTTVGTTTSGGNLVAASSNVSVSTNTGALVVVGGAGIGGNLNLGGILNIAGTGNVITLNNSGISGVNRLWFADPGPNEGLAWVGGSGWSIYESPNDLTTNSAGNLQIVRNGVRSLTVDTNGTVTIPNNQASSSSTTGALVVAGGVGIGGALISAGNIVAASGTASTSTTTGALVVRGGIGVSANVNAASIVATNNLEVGGVRIAAYDFGNSLSESGWQRFPGGLIIQWGNIPQTNTATSGSATFPIPFPSAVVNVTTQDTITGGDTGGFDAIVGITNFPATLTGFSWSKVSARGFYWMAIGY